MRHIKLFLRKVASLFKNRDAMRKKYYYVNKEEKEKQKVYLGSK